MAAATLVDLARHTTHALAQHFRSYLSRHAGAPSAPGMMRPRGVLFTRGVATDSSGGVRGRNGGIDAKTEDRGKVKAEDRGRDLQAAASSTTIASTSSRVSASSMSSSGTLTSSKDSALVRQMKKGKRWLSRTSHRLATETPRDNRRVKAEALRPRSGDVMNVGLNAIASSGSERKNILGFDGGHRRNIPATTDWGRSQAVGGVPQSHVYMTRFRGSNPTDDLVNRLYGFDGVARVERDRKTSVAEIDKKKGATERDKKKSAAEKGKKMSATERDKKKSAASADGKKKANAGEKKKRKRYSTDKTESSDQDLKSFDYFSSKRGEEVTKSKLNRKVSSQQQVSTVGGADMISQKTAKKRKKPASDSECAQKTRRADTRKSSSQDSVSRSDANLSISWSDADPIPRPPAPNTEKRADVTWKEMKEQPEVWADDIKKRLELYSKQYLSSPKPIGKQCIVKNNDELSQVEKQGLNSGKDICDVSVVKSVKHLKRSEKKNAALVTELTPELKNVNAEIVSRNKKAVLAVPGSRSGKEPQLVVTLDDLSPKSRSKSAAAKTVDVASQCESDCKTNCKAKSRARENKKDKTPSDVDKTANRNLALLPPATDAEMWSKVLIERMEQIKLAAGVYEESTAKDVSKHVKDVVKSSVGSSDKSSSRNNKVVVYKPMALAAVDDAATTKEKKSDPKQMTPKVLTQRDRQLIEDIRKQWAHKFKAKLDRILRMKSQRSPAVKTTPSDAEVFSTPMNSVKTSPLSQRSNGASLGNGDYNMDDVLDVKPFDHPEDKIIPLTQSDLAYWEWLHCRDDAGDEAAPMTEVVPLSDPNAGVNKTGEKQESSSTTSRAADEILRDMGETYLRSDFKTIPTQRLEKKSNNDTNVNDEFLPKLKLRKQERRQLKRIIEFLNNLPAKGDTTGCDSLDGLMEMRLQAVEDKPELQTCAKTKATTPDRESEICCSPKSINRHSASDIIHDIQDLLNDGDKLSATLNREREDKVTDARRELMASYRKNIRRHQRVLDRYRGKLWKLRLMEVEQRAAKNRRTNFKEH